jgi:hypothetical protein
MVLKSTEQKPNKGIRLLKFLGGGVLAFCGLVDYGTDALGGDSFI